MEVKESNSNRFHRRCMTFLMNTFAVLGSIFLAGEIILFRGFYSIPAVVLVGVGWYFRRRINRLYLIGPDKLEFAADGTKSVVRKEDIIKIKKLIRFTVSERHWMVIIFRKPNSGKDRYLFQNEPGIDLKSKFREMGVPLENTPQEMLS